MTDRPTDEAELVRRCLAGDPAATGELLARFRPDVYSLCWRMLRHEQDAEDVYQDVCWRVIRGLAHYDPQRPLRPWILTIAVNRCRTAMSQRQRRPTLAEAPEIWEAPSRPLPPHELTAALEAAVAQLRDDYREVFLLFHEQAQPYDEISRIVGRPVGTIKTWLHRARLEVLKSLIAAGFGAECRGIAGDDLQPHLTLPFQPA